MDDAASSSVGSPQIASPAGSANPAVAMLNFERADADGSSATDWMFGLVVGVEGKRA
jgi:hypothetical protein